MHSHNPTQALPLFFTASKHPAHSNARNFILLKRLLQDSLDTRWKVAQTSVFALLGFATHYPLFSIHFLLIGNRLGSAGGASAMASNSGNFSRRGSGTFTFEPFKMLISCSALTTPFP
jgi:hypothetical protein